MSCQWCRWQAERRKHYPTADNVTRKSEAVAEREARGELEPETALRRKRLQEVHSHRLLILYLIYQRSSKRVSLCS
jgi:hypothetical protein